MSPIARLLSCVLLMLDVTACQRPPSLPASKATPHLGFGGSDEDRTCANRFQKRNGQVDARAAASRGEYKMLYLRTNGEEAHSEVPGSSCLIDERDTKGFFELGASETFGCDACSAQQASDQCGKAAFEYATAFNVEMLRRAPQVSVQKLDSLPACHIKLRDVIYLESIGQLDRIPDTKNLFDLPRRKH